MLRPVCDLKALSLGCPALREMLPLAAEKAGRGDAAARLKVADWNAMKRRNFTSLLCLEFHRFCFVPSAHVGRDSLLFCTARRAKQKSLGWKSGRKEWQPLPCSAQDHPPCITLADSAGIRWKALVFPWSASQTVRAISLSRGALGENDNEPGRAQKAEGAELAPRLIQVSTQCH